MNETLRYAYDLSLSDEILDQAASEQQKTGDLLAYSSVYNSSNYERVEFSLERGIEAEQINDFLDDFTLEKSETVVRILLSYLDSDVDIVALAKGRKSDACMRRNIFEHKKIKRFGFYLRKDNPDHMRFLDFMYGFDSISRSHIFCVVMCDYIEKQHGGECLTLAEKLLAIRHKQDRIRRELKTIQKESGFSKSDFDALLKNNGIDL